jgi:hypothetical protein
VEAQRDRLGVVVEVDEAPLVALDDLLDGVLDLRLGATGQIIELDLGDTAELRQVDPVTEGDVGVVVQHEFVDREVLDVERERERRFLVLWAVVVTPSVREDVEDRADDLVATVLGFRGRHTSPYGQNLLNVGG